MVLLNNVDNESDEGDLQNKYWSSQSTILIAAFNQDHLTDQSLIHFILMSITRDRLLLLHITHFSQTSFKPHSLFLIPAQIFSR